MTQHDERSIDPDSVTDWAEWGKQQGGRWSQQARNWRTEAWSWSHPQEAAQPRPLWSRILWGIIGIPVGAVGATLVLAIVLIGATAGLIFLLLAAWLAMGLISAGLARRSGWPSELGALFGFALGPIGMLLVRRLPSRRLHR